MPFIRVPPHPAKGVLAINRISISSLAEQLGRSRYHLGKVLNGIEPASAELRAEVAALLNVDEDKLFRPVPISPRFPGNDALRQRRLDAQSRPNYP